LRDAVQPVNRDTTDTGEHEVFPDGLEEDVAAERRLVDRQILLALQGEINVPLPDPRTVQSNAHIRIEDTESTKSGYSGGPIRSIQKLRSMRHVVRVNTVACNKHTVRRMVCEYAERKRRGFSKDADWCVTD